MDNEALSTPELKTVDMPYEFRKAEEQGKKLANKNKFYIKDSYFDKYDRKNFDKLKNYRSNTDILNSTEYNDMKLLLDICKEHNIKPLFIIMPVNGPWYDYISVDKQTRHAYYSKVKNIIKSYGFETCDYSEHEYEPYLMEDGMHLGWKGWLYVNETISNFVKQS